MAMLRLATFNVLHGLDLADGSNDPAGLKAAVRELDADVLGLQELDRRQPRSSGADQAAVAAHALGARWHRFVPTVTGTPGVRGWVPARSDDPDDSPSYGIALLSRHPVRRWAVRRFGPAPARLPLVVKDGRRGRLMLVRDEPRAAVAAHIDGPGGEFTVIATHLSFVPGFNVRQLRAIVRWALPMPGPVFLLGDLNLPGSLPARVTGWQPLVDAATYPAPRPKVQLDHILARGLRAGAVQAEHRWAPTVSDHRPLSVDVEL
jgi:endonuclease/exonuclease/phosphatase family metal-dependent hydrolase